MSSSSNGLEREIEEYQDVSSGSYESGEGSTIYGSSSLDKDYLSGVPGIPLEEFQEMLRKMASGAGTSSSKGPPSPQEEEEKDVIYSCAPKVASTLDTLKLKTLVDRYQIPREFNPRLPMEGEWCCSPSSGLGVYTSYLLAGLRFPLNSFCRHLLHTSSNSNGTSSPIVRAIWRAISSKPIKCMCNLPKKNILNPGPT